MITLSIVSHGQWNLVKILLQDIEKYCKNTPIEIILTLNIPENISDNSFPKNYPFSTSIIKNNSPKGFGANHNAAFLKSTGDYFCVLNPDIRLINNPFPALISSVNKKNIGVSGPIIINQYNIIQDSAREFLTIPRLLKRIFLKKPVFIRPETENPDWIAGMFMLFKKDIYTFIQGFDERYFLYCEDMDLCRRLNTKNLRVSIEINTRVIHDAQRTSHKNLKYLYWHLHSLVTYLTRPTRP